jgi:WD40 repeat protein
MTLEGHSHAITVTQFSPDGSNLMSASRDRTIRVWDPSTGAQLYTLEGHSASVVAVCFSPDGSRLASVSEDKKVILWHASTGVRLHTLEGHSDSVDAVCFSPDGSRLASASRDRTIRVWDLSTKLSPELFKAKSQMSDLWSSADGSLDETKAGRIRLTSAPESLPTDDMKNQYLEVRGKWIFRCAQNMIWLPSEHRPLNDAIAINGAIMTFDNASGRLSVWEVSN